MKRITTTLQRKIRISRKVRGTDQKPRLSVFRSNHQIAVQLIDDVAGKTIIGVSEKHLENTKGPKIARAKALGIIVAAKALEKKISQVVFDKGSYRYHGRVKAVAEGAREGGLDF
jgi:large subunit ribosomal protein L18